MHNITRTTHQGASPSDPAYPSYGQWDSTNGGWLTRQAPSGYRALPRTALEASAWAVATGSTDPAPLGNNASSATPPQRARRSQRYILRGFSGVMSHSKSVGKCGRVRVSTGTYGVNLVVSEHGARFTGLAHCGSVWECPVCMAAIARERSGEVQSVVTQHRESGGGAYMLTLTLPHDVGDALKPMRKRVAYAWRKTTAGAAYTRAKQRIGLVGTIRAMEITHGRNGWHPHLHILVLTQTKLRDAQIAEYTDCVYRRWCDFITRVESEDQVPYRVPSREHGITFVESHKDDYITKLGLADELTQGARKLGTDDHQTPLQILQVIASPAQTKRDVLLWVEYANGMRGARQLTWSRGLKQLYNITEKSDEEIANDEEVDDKSDVIFCGITSSFWDRHLKNNPWAQVRLLSCAEAGDRSAADRFIWEMMAEDTEVEEPDDGG